MTSPITITVPREAALLLLAAEFMQKAADHVTANPETLRVLSQRAGDVSVTVGSIGGDEQELSDIMEELEAAAPAPAPVYGRGEQPLVQIMDDVFIPADEETAPAVDVAAAFAPKKEPTPSLFAEYVMADPDGFTREQYHAAGWTDAQLLKAGHMAEVVKTPAAPVAAAPTPPPAPTAPAPTSTTTPAPTPAPPTSGATASGGEVDSEGTPWDARIHAGTKTKMASDGTWKLKRGVDKSIVDQVKAELRALTGGKPAVAAPPVASAPTAPKAPPAAGGAVAPGAALMKRVTDAIRQGQIGQADVLAAAQHATVGLKEVRELCIAGNEHLVPIAEAILFPQG